MEDPGVYHYTTEVGNVKVRVALACGIQHVPERKMAIGSYTVNGKHGMQSVTEDGLSDEEIEERLLEKILVDLIGQDL